MEQLVFALDIGTRTVNGILLKKVDRHYEVINHYALEHEQRSMLDGQIHNVKDVAAIIRKVKENLETEDEPLSSVYVAAAGRSLKTIRGTAEISLQETAISDEEMVKHLELSAVYKAQEKLVSNDDQNTYSDYHCVGYSVVHYHLDGERIGSLIDQKGETASVEVIATFLPKIVVDSLIAALKRAGLEMRALTLEPIAAIQVLIPDSMRRLNVALVDIGAGTSDIAITNEGTVTAYGMVPIAGDEITEVLSDEYLLDYPLAEKIKRTISETEPATIHDILGFETTIEYDHFIQTIRPTIEKLTDAISKEILKLNGQSPKAVMLIGGGSLTPDLHKLLAEKLNLANNRVAVRGVEALQNITINDDTIEGPDFITPIGIAVTAKENPVHFLTAVINNQEVKIFEMNNLTIGDAIIQAGIPIHQFYGRPGQAIFIQINHEDETIPGTFGTPPTIYKNGEISTVDDLIMNRDNIIIQKGIDGTSPEVTLREYFGEPLPKRIQLNGEMVKLQSKFIVNQEVVTPEYIIRDNDKIETINTMTFNDLLQTYLSNNDKNSKDLTVTVDKEKIKLKQNTDIYICRNGVEVALNDMIHDGDNIEFKNMNPPTVKTLFQKINQPLTKMIQITFNNTPIQIEHVSTKLIRIKTNETLGLDDELKPFDQLQTHTTEDIPFIFQDVFRYIDIDLKEVTGRFKISVNDRAASFDTPIEDGDRLTLTFD